jgi:antibiotic biosynthesis monooxygenase (ABM) superfamily enzyme
MQHDGHVLAADEPDHDYQRPAGVASVHTRALVTWVAIYPLAAIGMYALASLAPAWPVAVRALVLTAVVVPVTVYLTVPRLLLVVLALTDRRRRNVSSVSTTGATP